MIFYCNIFCVSFVLYFHIKQKILHRKHISQIIQIKSYYMFIICYYYITNITLLLLYVLTKKKCVNTRCKVWLANLVRLVIIHQSWRHKRAQRVKSRVQNAIFSRGSIDRRPTAWNKRFVFSRARYARDRPNPPLSPASIEPPSRPRKNAGRQIFWRKHVEKTRGRVVTIF